LHVLIVLLNEGSDFLTNPLEFFDIDTEAMHFFQNFGELLVFVQEHLVDLFLEQSLLDELGRGVDWGSVAGLFVMRNVRVVVAQAGFGNVLCWER
jgi:hypothetical protein